MLVSKKQCLMFLSMICFLTMGASLVQGSSEADGWSSSGGDLSSAATNPWWVYNTKEVNYCVAVDEVTSSATEQLVVKIVGEVIDYWKEDFSGYKKFYDPDNRKQIIATQKFNRISCDGSEDLKFQIGDGTLSELQRKYFGDRLSTIAGIAVRTHYDEVAMAGKGFIFLAGDKARENKPWSNEGALFRTLAHEMGHVFGLQHRDGTIMDQSGPSKWIEWKSADYPKPYCQKQPPKFSSFFPEFYSCSILFDIGFFNGKQNDRGCIRLTWQDPSDVRSPIEVRTQSFWHSNHTEKLVGQIQRRSTHLGGGYSTGSGSLSNIFLPSTQAIFPENNNTTKPVVGVLYPLLFKADKALVFEPTEGEDRLIDKFEWTSDSLRISSEHNDVIDIRKDEGDFYPLNCL